MATQTVTEKKLVEDGFQETSSPCLLFHDKHEQIHFSSRGVWRASVFVLNTPGIQTCFTNNGQRILSHRMTKLIVYWCRMSNVTWKLSAFICTTSTDTIYQCSIHGSLFQWPEYSKKKLWVQLFLCPYSW